MPRSGGRARIDFVEPELPAVEADHDRVERIDAFGKMHDDWSGQLETRIGGIFGDGMHPLLSHGGRNQPHRGEQGEVTLALGSRRDAPALRLNATTAEKCPSR